MVNIALVMMIRNEEKRLAVTLESVLGVVNSFIIYDTMSTDNTVQILQEFTQKHSIPLHLIQGEFVNFAASRNVLLDYADTIPNVDLLLMLDSNDELQNGNLLLERAKGLVTQNTSAWMLQQIWRSPSINKYLNVRLIKPRCGWRYNGVVHEFIKNVNNPNMTIGRMPDIILFQDRTADDDKSFKRFSKDYELLLAEHEREPNEPRTVFYLAQTCSCLHKYEEAYKYYELRSTMSHGFYEEIYQSCYSCGIISQKHLDMPWSVSMSWFMKALECTPRAEPCLEIAKHYRDKNWFLCYNFAKMACDQEYPTNHYLWVDSNVYEYERYFIMGIAAYYHGKYDEGIAACKKAIEARDCNQSKQNLEFYYIRIKEKNDEGLKQKHRNKKYGRR